MKIKTIKKSYDEVLKLPYKKHQKPLKPNSALKKLINTLSDKELAKVNFKYESVNMQSLDNSEPCLFLMNHSCFLDLMIASHILKDRPFNIVCTSDGFVGKELLMRMVGCIPTQKFVNDLTLVKDINYCVKKLKTSVLMYPEASYSFDGTKTPLPPSLGKCIKMLGVPVVFIETFGAFLRDPLYNGLRIRNVDVSAKVTYLLSKEDIKNMSVEEINKKVWKCFYFDGFKWQKENKVKITEDFRTIGLERVLYKCPSCLSEGNMKGIGEKFVCKKCGKSYYMTEYGEMKAENTYTQFSHIPDWYLWQRKCAKVEVSSENYEIKIPVRIGILKDYKAIYLVGEGILTHNKDGFNLTGCDGKLNYVQSPKHSYSLYADYFWYEIDDVICIGDNKTLYYCFPLDDSVPVAKARLATEELYKIVNAH